MRAITRLTIRFTRASTRSAMLLSTLAATTALFALVIWIKLRVVTHVPRTAYADPRDEVPGPVQPIAHDETGETASASGAIDEVR